MENHAQEKLEAKAMLATVHHLLSGPEIANLDDMVDGYDEMIDWPMFRSNRTQFSKEIGEYIDRRGDA